MKSIFELRANARSQAVPATGPARRADNATARTRFNAIFGYLCRHRKYVIVATMVLVPGGLVCPAAIWLHRRFKRAPLRATNPGMRGRSPAQAVDAEACASSRAWS